MSTSVTVTACGCADAPAVHFELGFAWAAFRWASGHSLEPVLRDAEMQAGDFVRWTKQLIDLLGQIAVAARDSDGDAEAAGGSKTAVGRTARAAADLLRRGVVAYSSVA